jgi:rhodanese-related sulfurtransferase
MAFKSSSRTATGAFVRPGRSHFVQAWQIFVLSSMFAVLVNAFYPDGIDLKYHPPKKVNLAQLFQATPENHQSRPGFKDPWGKSPKAVPTPVPADSSRIPRLSLSGAKDRFDKKTALFLDARNPDKYAEGHIPDAVNFPANEIDRYAPKVMPLLTDKSREIVCYCDGGDCTLSLELAQTLLDQGFQKVEVFEGGFPQWSKAGYPVGKGGTP